MKKELTNRFYALEREDGGVSVLRLIRDAHIDAEVARWESSNNQKITRVTPIDEADVPKDRYYRDAWTFDGKKFGVDLVKAQTIHKRHVQRAIEKELRDPMAVLRLTEERKAYLLDVHTNFDTSEAKTVAELKQLWPKDIAK